MLGGSLLIGSIQEYSYRCPNGLAALVDRVIREEAIAHRRPRSRQCSLRQPDVGAAVLMARKTATEDIGYAIRDALGGHVHHPYRHHR
jgi:hypothetical protein